MCGKGLTDGGANTPLANLHRLTAFRLTFPLSPTHSCTGFRKSLNERGQSQTRIADKTGVCSQC